MKNTAPGGIVLIRALNPALTCLAALLSGLFAIATPASALPEDRDQPIFIQSDRAERDDRKGTTVYTGDVEIDQGSMHISADRVTVFQAEDEVSRIVATGNPAKMHQRPEPEREPVYSRARTIQYEVQDEVLTLLEDASVTQEGTTVTGDRIEYFSKEQRVKATGGGATPGKDRVKVVIPPRRNASPAEAPVPAPTTGTSGPG